MGSKDLLKPGDVMLTFNKLNTLSKWIANVTRSQWSHTMMYIGNGNVVESTVGGVQITPVNHYFTKKYKQAILRHKVASDEEKKQIVEDALDLLGKKYGYLQIIWYLFLRVIGKSENPKWQLDIQPRAMVCSEAIAIAYEQAGYPVKEGMKPAGIEPVDFEEADGFELVT